MSGDERAFEVAAARQVPTLAIAVPGAAHAPHLMLLRIAPIGHLSARAAGGPGKTGRPRKAVHVRSRCLRCGDEGLPLARGRERAEALLHTDWWPIGVWPARPMACMLCSGTHSQS